MRLDEIADHVPLNVVLLRRLFRDRNLTLKKTSSGRVLGQIYDIEDHHDGTWSLWYSDVGAMPDALVVTNDEMEQLVTSRMYDGNYLVVHDDKRPGGS